MRLIQWLFRLLEKFVPVTKSELLSLEDEGNRWYDNLLRDRKSVV